MSNAQKKKRPRVPRHHALGVLSTIATVAFIVAQAKPLCGALQTFSPAAGEVCRAVTGLADEIDKNGEKK